MPYLLCLGDQTLTDLIERIAEDAGAVAPGLGRDRARALATTILRARAVQTEACGLHPECAPGAAVWPGHAPPSGPVRPAELRDLDPYDLPNVFAVAAGDLVGEDSF